MAQLKLLAIQILRQAVRTTQARVFLGINLYKAGIGAWYDSDTVDKYWQLFSASKPSVELMQKALRSYGYEVIATGQLDSQTLDALSAFQMHFLPWHVSGNSDARSAAVLFALLDKYFPKKLSGYLKNISSNSKRLSQSQKHWLMHKL